MMWQTQTTIEYPFALRPASIEEAGLFYSQMDEAEDAVLGTVGHMTMRPRKVEALSLLYRPSMD